jgi:hypothetical protein
MYNIHSYYNYMNIEYAEIHAPFVQSTHTHVPCIIAHVFHVVVKQNTSHEGEI